MSVARRAASQLLSSRSVHLRIQPRPANLSESREIMRVLQRFGELNMYKYLRYEYHNPADNIALAIYRNADSAQQALNASPIRFALETVAPREDGHNEDSLYTDVLEEDEITPNTPANDGIEEILRPSALLNRSPATSTTTPSTSPIESSSPLPFDPPTSPAPPTSSKYFQITIDRSRVIHQDYVERQPYWKQFTPMKSMAQEDLAKTVPHLGLSDVSKRPPHAHRTPNRVLKMMSDYVEYRMPSLRDMWEEGGREKKQGDVRER